MLSIPSLAHAEPDIVILRIDVMKVEGKGDTKLMSAVQDERYGAYSN